MEKSNGSKMVLSLALMAAVATLPGCGKVSSSTVKLKMSDGSIAALRWFQLIPNAYGAVSNLKLCFKRLRFKTMDEQTADPANDEDNVDLELGQMVIAANGETILGEVTIPAGEYHRVEFDLEKECPGSPAGSNSVEVSNDLGPFTTQDRVTIKFEGVFDANEANEEVSLGIVNILAALDLVTSNADIKSRLEDASVKGDL